MPNITIKGPPIKDLDVKRKLAKEVTDSASRAYGIPAQAFVILIKENLPENVAVGGCMLCDGRSDQED